MKKNKIECHCKKCGAVAYMITTINPDKIPEKEKEFECNDCVWKRWQKEGKQKKLL